MTGHSRIVTYVLGLNCFLPLLWNWLSTLGPKMAEYRILTISRAHWVLLVSRRLPTVRLWTHNSQFVKEDLKIHQLQSSNWPHAPSPQWNLVATTGRRYIHGSFSSKHLIIFWPFNNEDILWTFKSKNCPLMRSKLSKRRLKAIFKRLWNVLETIKEIVIAHGRKGRQSLGGEQKICI